MCDDPGTLLCRGELNDCSGKGDCYKGSCYCFIGWGGPDCSVRICEGECEDVRRRSHCAHRRLCLSIRSTR